MGFIDEFISKMMGEDFCLADSATTHTILKDKKYFQQLILSKAKVNTILGSSNLIEGSGRANIMLPKRTKNCIDDVLYFFKSKRNLLSFKDIRGNGYHFKTNNEGSEEYLYITSMISEQKLVLEKVSIFSFGLYYATMRTIEAIVAVHQKCSNPNIFTVWHDHLGHPGSVMMGRIIKNSYGHPLKNQKILLPSDYPCSAYSQGKLIIIPSPLKIAIESPSFLERIQGDICGPIHPPSGPFKCFMVLIDASTRWSHVCLIST